MHVDGFSVHTHRMFGVPPEELTFYCKWDFCAGDWLVDSSPMFMRGVAGGISNLELASWIWKMRWMWLSRLL